jgi:glutathione S-transferase
MAPTVKLIYFDIEARGEVRRLLLKSGNIVFEDVRLSFADWPKHKAATPMGQVPVLYWDGEELAQSAAITRFLARKVGLAGNSDLEFAQADMVACHCDDLTGKIPGLRFSKTQADRETDATAFLREFLPKWMEPLETLLKKRGGAWYAGSGPTFADLKIMVLMDFIHEPEEMMFKDMNNVDERRKIIDAFPLVKANYQRTSALPAVVEWKRKRPAFNGF